jgi:hypothetical protein
MGFDHDVIAAILSNLGVNFISETPASRPCTTFVNLFGETFGSVR